MNKKKAVARGASAANKEIDNNSELHKYKDIPLTMIHII